MGALPPWQAVQGDHYGLCYGGQDSGFDSSVGHIYEEYIGWWHLRPDLQILTASQIGILAMQQLYLDFDGLV